MNLSLCVVALAVATQAPPAIDASAGVCNVCDVCETGCPEKNECRPWSRRRRDAFGRDCFGHGRCRRGCSCCSTCNMFPHYAYMPVNYGYYYFRPYNWRMIAPHQNIACSWGLDPINPYTRVMFETLYSDLPRATPVVPIPDINRDPSLESLLEQ